MPSYDTVRIGENVWEQVPRTDIEQHLLGDECWCEPNIQFGPPMMCHDGFARPATIITHNHRIKDIQVLANRLAPPPGGGIIKGSTNNKGDKNG
jgi:hypothetical protein